MWLSLGERGLFSAEFSDPPNPKNNHTKTHVDRSERRNEKTWNFFGFLGHSGTQKGKQRERERERERS